MEEVTPASIACTIFLLWHIFSHDSQFQDTGIATGIPYAEYYDEIVDLLCGFLNKGEFGVFQFYNDIVFPKGKGAIAGGSGGTTSKRTKAKGQEAAERLGQMSLNEDQPPVQSTNPPRPPTFSYLASSPIHPPVPVLTITTSTCTTTTLPIPSPAMNATPAVIAQPEPIEPDNAQPAPARRGGKSRVGSTPAPRVTRSKTRAA
ncbi:hypothetical protein BDN72DRAFT_438457 [Pluteus cervinus]|uniref:Uncharacterized protein n=1 Tax=Pluteus cervinus TaxID=181527 RepID=A0ACD3A7J5_9AGAR|nr:hypothetical protein BDN72DRAFT_438457 [Pluteus cervinus]